MSEQEGKPTTAKQAKASAKAAKAEAKALRPWYKKPLFIIIAAVVLIAVINSVSGGNSESTSSETLSTGEPAVTATESATAVEEEAAIEVTAQKLKEDLEANALNAANTYEGKRLIVTGKVGSIDASGDYFSLEGTDEFSFTFVQIYINDDQVATVSGYTKGQDVTVTGTVTDVGEIIGYSIDAESLS